MKKEIFQSIGERVRNVGFRYVFSPVAWLATGMYALFDDDFRTEMIDSMAVAAGETGRVSRFLMSRLYLLNPGDRRRGFEGIWRGLDYYHRTQRVQIKEV